jgi:hypothetical protein
MAYNITYSLGTITVNDSTLNSQTSLNLPGRNYAGYGQPVNQDLVNLLQSFAGPSAPINAIPGQLWFNNSSKVLTINTSGNATPTWTNLVVSSNTSNATFNDLTVAGTLTTRTITTGGAAITGTITGNWTLTAGSRLQATYADLAERFESDTVYDAGTVVELGGDREITAVKDELSERVFGVISDTAGYIMNGAAGSDETHPAVAMTGRVKVKVLGPVKKGDRLVSAGRGYARAASDREATSFNVVGRSLEDKTTDNEGKVLSAVSARI